MITIVIRKCACTLSGVCPLVLLRTRCARVSRAQPRANRTALANSNRASRSSRERSAPARFLWTPQRGYALQRAAHASLAQRFEQAPHSAPRLESRGKLRPSRGRKTIVHAPFRSCCIGDRSQASAFSRRSPLIQSAVEGVMAMNMKLRRSIVLAASAAPIALFSVVGTTQDQEGGSRNCSALPSHAQLRAALIEARGQNNGGFDLDMWGAVVNRDGIVCAVAFTGEDRGDQWPGSRVIAAQKANTANAFSLPGQIG